MHEHIFRFRILNIESISFNFFLCCKRFAKFTEDVTIPNRSVVCESIECVTGLKLCNISMQIAMRSSFVADFFLMVRFVAMVSETVVVSLFYAITIVQLMKLLYFLFFVFFLIWRDDGFEFGENFRTVNKKCYHVCEEGACAYEGCSNLTCPGGGCYFEKCTGCDCQGIHTSPLFLDFLNIFRWRLCLLSV